MGSRGLFFLITLCAGCAVALPAAEVETMDGRVMQATVTGETATSISLEMRVGGTSSSMTLPKRVIHRWREDARSPWQVITAKPESEPEPEPEAPAAEASADSDSEAEAEAPPAVVTAMGWRGDYTGHFPDARPPLRWSESENLAWKRPLAARSHASPIVVGERVFCCIEPYTLACFDRRTGAPLWQRACDFATVLGPAHASDPEPSFQWKNYYGYATPTPVSDGELVWTVFGHGVLVCHSVAGELVWAEPVKLTSRVAGAAASPVLLGDRLIIGTRGSGVTAFDARSGQQLWSAGKGNGSYGGMTPLSIGGRPHILHPAGLLIDANSGSIVARDLHAEKDNRNWGPSPVIAGGVGVLHFHRKSSGMNQTLMRAFRFGSSAPELLWEYDTNTGGIGGRMSRSALIHDGLVYAVRDDGLLQVLGLENGKLIYSQDLPGGSRASLTMAGGAIFHVGKRAVVVFAPGSSYRELSRFEHPFGKAGVPSPVYVDRAVYFRSVDALWCFVNRADS